ncbi:O-antigen/teichoic acid export membrane protein [Bacillus sp. SORGH_AS 510]|uniref:putative polysaccharide biosynthesis protein n=1 Tax=Bacillus sp. SORGH_AS_0510 TaxID=3041771 RepID=UPI00277D2D6A|nr:oligosaccharide flippase family protein [Bacillus sp. SORGH_AS_0510]MDQ1143333.1 O-antigen/teichoic acid export membrane protein [Bacillus sp. SORGH_AS_0510]
MGEAMYSGKSANQSKALFRGAFILTIAALVVKILSAFYRIPFQNIVGDVGFYIYQQVYPIYGMAIVLSTTGFPVVISKLYAEQREKGNAEKSRLLLFTSFIYLQLFGFICFLVLYLGAERIALWMNDPHLAILLRVVSIVYLTFPFVSLLRGYYQGIGNMVPTALSQVGEQTIRVLTILVLSYLFMQKGYSLYLVGGGAMFGSITGTIVSSIILFMFLWIRKEWKGIAPTRGMFRTFTVEAKEIVMALTLQGLMICLSGMLLILIQLADSMNLYSLLTNNGFDKEYAKSLKGIFDRGQPLIQLGTVAATSMSLTLVPLITRERIAEEQNNLTGKIQMALKVSIVIGLGASAGLWAIIRPTNIMLFENDLGSTELGILGFVILFTSIILTIIAIMQGLGRLLFPALAVTISFPIKYGLNMLLVPWVGTRGAAISTIITLAFVTLLLLVRLRKMLAASLLTGRFFTTVLLATVVMVVFLKGYILGTNPLLGQLGIERIGAAVQALSAVCFGGILFMIIIIRGRVFLEEELALFPLGNRLIHFLARKDRT